jgi:hypothetical protein
MNSEEEIPVEEMAVEATPEVHPLDAAAYATFQGPQPVPSIGRVVHYKLPAGPNRGEYRPALIVRVWGEATPDSAVQLQVFTDGHNDGPEYAAGIHWATSVKHDESGTEFGTWKWPPYVPAK